MWMEYRKNCSSSSKNEWMIYAFIFVRMRIQIAKKCIQIDLNSKCLLIFFPQHLNHEHFIWYENRKRCISIFPGTKKKSHRICIEERKTTSPSYVIVSIKWVLAMQTIKSVPIYCPKWFSNNTLSISTSQSSHLFWPMWHK